MYLGPVLEAIKLRIVDIINKSWDTNWFGERAEYTLSPGGGYDRLSINILSYPVMSRWAFFTSNIEIDNFEQAAKLFSIKQVTPVNIIATAEYGYNYTLAKNKLLESLKITSQMAVKAGVKVRIATAHGLESKHLYVEFDMDHNEMVQKLVFIMVIKNTKK